MSILKGYSKLDKYGEKSQDIDPYVIPFLAEHPFQVGKVRWDCKLLCFGVFFLSIPVSVCMDNNLLPKLVP